MIEGGAERGEQCRRCNGQALEPGKQDSTVSHDQVVGTLDAESCEPIKGKGVRMPAKGNGMSRRKDGRYMARYTIPTPDEPRWIFIYGWVPKRRRVAEALGV